MVFSGVCDESGRQEVERVFDKRVAELVGGPRLLAQSLESMGLCIAQKKAYEPSYRAFFEASSAKTSKPKAKKP